MSLVSSFILDKKCYVELVGYSSMMTLLVNITVEYVVLVDGDLKIVDNSIFENKYIFYLLLLVYTESMGSLNCLVIC